MVEPVGLVLGGLWAFSHHKKRRATTQRELNRVKKEEAEAALEAESQRRRDEKQARRRELEAVEDVQTAVLRSLSAGKGLSSSGGKLILVRRLKAGLDWTNEDVTREALAAQRMQEQRQITTGAQYTARDADAKSAHSSTADLDASLDAQDLYAVLGVSSDADKRVIRRAYQRLALSHHPDRQPSGDSEAQAAATRRFQCIAFAYEILSDEEARRRYDASPAQFWSSGGVSQDWSFDPATFDHSAPMDPRAVALFMRECIAEVLGELRKVNPVLGLLFGTVLNSHAYLQTLDSGIGDLIGVWNALSPNQRREIMAFATFILEG